MKGFRVYNADESGVYGFDELRSDAEELLELCKWNDPGAHIKPYEFESVNEKACRLEKKNDELKTMLATLYDATETEIKVGHIYAQRYSNGISFFICLAKDTEINGKYTLMRIPDSYQLKAYGAVLKDGNIQWDYSTNGRFMSDQES